MYIMDKIVVVLKEHGLEEIIDLCIPLLVKNFNV